jgi:glutamate/tyrosine decarboxylase-like PLP-dependent enzyme
MDMKHLTTFRLEEQSRHELWQRLIEAVETYLVKVETRRVTPELDPDKIRALLKRFDFAEPLNPIEAMNFVVENLWQYQVHVSHPMYYGLFNPAPTTISIVADALVAAFNPQLAAWSHNPLAVEIEEHVCRALAGRFGYEPSTTEGTFATGGAEANHTALLTALTRAFPDFLRAGVRALAAQPVLYISTEGHHSFLKAARLCGLGTEAVREIPTDDRLQMNVEMLESRIRQDRTAGFAPFMVVATMGTTSAGIVDPVARIADVAAREGLWLHADAAWGGAAALAPEFHALLDGIERADSITFDAHKWFSVPMGAGVYLTRHPGILERTFRVTAGGYMPRDGAGLEVVDPYAHSIQWSRRFIGLKVFMSLMVAGWDGYAAAVRHMMAMGQLLRRELEAAGWELVNPTALPVACFVDREHSGGRSAAYLEAIAHEIVSSGKAWLSTVRLGGTIHALRACITNYRTGPDEVRALVQVLDEARQQVQRHHS